MTALSGMKEICKHFPRSEATILKLIREEGFPAEKVAGIWESDTDYIDLWRRRRLAKLVGINADQVV